MGEKQISQHVRKIANSMKIGVLFIVVGVLFIGLSIYLSLQIFAFIGLSLTFWGALFLLITPVRYVEGSLLQSTVLPSYSTVDRIVKDFNLRGEAYYIPPYPRDVYLPEHLGGLKEMVVFISAESGDNPKPSIEGMAEGKFSIANPKGVFVNPPGPGLLGQLEQRRKVDFTKMPISEICEVLPSFLLGDLSLAKEMTLSAKENEVTLRVGDSIYKGMYGGESKPKSLNLLGCPIVSAIACAIAKSSGKFVSIQKLRVSSDGTTIEAVLQIATG